ncbi:MarR family winged helix-turn-helix transcriptional regulator [Saccharopolyspora sp. NPDC047091]|uniref:MarR family winged helix-turn-helix transcriptional regulator n=1 Tax=Saccharopolyspora sp. NPDC047091 TaxID=3155924 RepID=UPI0033C398EA
MGPTPETCSELLRPLRALMGLKQTAVQILNQQARTDLPYAASGLLGELVHCGESRASELAAHRFVDASVVSRQVSQLETAGLITRRADPQDRRVSLLRATEEGEQALARIERHRAEWLSSALSDWDDSRVRDLAELLDHAASDLRRAVLPEHAAAHEETSHPARPQVPTDDRRSTASSQEGTR